MKWTLKGDDYIEDETSQIVCILPTGLPNEHKKTLEKAQEMREALAEYVEETDGGSLPAKKMYNRFKTILDDINRGAA